MICKVKKEYTKKIDLLIKKYVADTGNFMQPDLFLSRIIWNYFSNNNKERGRSEFLLDKLYREKINEKK